MKKLLYVINMGTIQTVFIDWFSLPRQCDYADQKKIVTLFFSEFNRHFIDFFILQVIGTLVNNIDIDKR